MPVAINVFGSRQPDAAGRSSSTPGEEWDARLEFFLDPKPPEGILDKLKALPKLTELAAVFPKTVRAARARRSSRPATPSTRRRSPS